jgi:hypothetical protein
MLLSFCTPSVSMEGTDRIVRPDLFCCVCVRRMRFVAVANPIDNRRVLDLGVSHSRTWPSG